ncbi:MAG TPA: cbb3-type cytochrome oxidase assembly protein CcoS [Ignavibacteria bacterium]|jgi:cbb3-type cytochrome oxidase maturation protein
MSVILLLIFFSMLVAGGFLLAFLWAVKNGQYDDQYTPSVRVLFDNDIATNHNQTSEVLKTSDVIKASNEKI